MEGVQWGAWEGQASSEGEGVVGWSPGLSYDTWGLLKKSEGTVEAELISEMNSEMLDQSALPCVVLAFFL